MPPRSLTKKHFSKARVMFTSLALDGVAVDCRFSYSLEGYDTIILFRVLFSQNIIL